MNSKTSNSRSTLNNCKPVPSHIVSRIFHHLRLEDRKNARLACRSWYESSLHPTLTGQEKFFFGEHNVPGSSGKDFAEILLNSKSECMNVQFDSVNAEEVEDLSEDVWKRCGNRVKTITILVPEPEKRGPIANDALNYDVFIKNIIAHCVNLTSLTVGNAPAKSFFSSDILDSLIAKRIRLSKLQSFVYHFAPYAAERNAYLFKDDKVLKKIFRLFPNIEDLRFGTLWYWRICHGIRKSEMGECLNSLAKLDSISFNVLTDGSWMTKSICRQKWASRFVAFEAQFHVCLSFLKILHTFFENQTNLQIVMLCVLQIGVSDALLLLFHILECCPKLRDLQLKFNDDKTFVLILTYQQFTKFESFVRNFKNVKINGCIVIQFSSKEQFPSICPKLFDLKIECRRM